MSHWALIPWMKRGARGGSSVVAVLLVLLVVILVGAGLAVKLVILDTREEHTVMGYEEMVTQSAGTRSALARALAREQQVYQPTEALLLSMHKAPPALPVTMPEVAAVTRLASGMKPSDIGLRFSGVSWHPARPLVMLNGSVYGIGDVVAGVTVAAITPNRLTVRDGTGATRTFSLYDE